LKPQEEEAAGEEAAPEAKARVKAPTVDSLMQTIDTRKKEIYGAKEKELHSNPITSVEHKRQERRHQDPRKYDEKVLLPELQRLLYTWETFPGKDRLPLKEGIKYKQAGVALMQDIRMVQLCHARVDATNDYFDFLIEMMDYHMENVDLLCAIAMEIASLTNLVYEQRRKQESSRSNFNPCNLIPFSKYFGMPFHQRCVVMKILQNYIFKFQDEYLTLCGMRALINLAALSDECKQQILGDGGGEMLNILNFRVKDYTNNESVLATFCMLMRNIASTEYGRQTISQNPDLRKRLLQLMKVLLSQEPMKMVGYDATRSFSRNLMSAEACACLWKLCQPYEPENARREREELMEQKKGKGKSKGKKEEYKYLESCILEDVVNGDKKFDFEDEILELLSKHVDAEEWDKTSDEVVEKACGLTMALAAADSVVQGMDAHLEYLDKQNPPKTKEIEAIKKIRVKQSKVKASNKKTMRKRMGEPYVRVLCKVLLSRNRSKPVVEKAAGALCVLLSDKDLVPYFKEEKDALEQFLSISITKQEIQLQNLVNRLNVIANT